MIISVLIPFVEDALPYGTSVAIASTFEIGKDAIESAIMIDS
jgi:hypothetical protein